MTAKNGKTGLRRGPNGYDLLKVIAILTMVIDHVGNFFFPDELWIRAIGRMAFPLFLFLVGYSHQFSVRWSLIAGCLFLIAVDAWTYYPIFPVNILSTIILVRITMNWAQKKEYLELPAPQLFLVLTVWQLLTMFFVEYGAVAAMYALVGYYARQEETPRRKVYASMAFVTLFHLVTQQFSFEFPVGDIAIMGVILVLAAILMLKLSLKELPMRSSLLRSAVLAISRNALLIYVVHVALFQIAETLLHPGPLDGNPWMRFSE